MDTEVPSEPKLNQSNIGYLISAPSTCAQIITSIEARDVERTSWVLDTEHDPKRVYGEWENFLSYVGGTEDENGGIFISPHFETSQVPVPDEIATTLRLAYTR